MNYIKFVSLNAEHIIDNPEHEVINMYMHIQIKLLVTTLLGEKNKNNTTLDYIHSCNI